MMAFVKRLFWTNRSSKLLAIALAALLWVYFSNQLRVPGEIKVQLRIQLENPDKYWILTENVDRLVTVKIKAPRKTLDALRSSGEHRSVEIVITESDLKDKKTFPAQITYKIDAIDWLPSEVEIEREIVHVNVEVDAIDSEPLPIEVVVTKANKNDPRTYVPFHKKVRVRIPRSKTQSLTSIRTVPVTFDDVGKGEVPFEAVYFGGRKVTFEPEGTKVAVQKERIERVFENIAVKLIIDEKFHKAYELVQIDSNARIDQLKLSVPKDTRIEGVEVVVDLTTVDNIEGGTTPQTFAPKVRLLTPGGGRLPLTPEQILLKKGQTLDVKISITKKE